MRARVQRGARAAQRPHPAGRRHQDQLRSLRGDQRRGQRRPRAPRRDHRRRLDPRAGRPRAGDAGRSSTTRAASSPPAAPCAPSTAARVSPGGSSGCGCRGSWLARAQVVEYLRSFLIGRTGWASMGTLLLISGAFGVYRRDVVIEAGGLDPDSIGEDFELCLRVHKMMRDRGRDYRVGLRARAGVLDRGAEHPRRAAPPADPLAPGPVGDAVGLPRDAVPAPVRAGRLGRAALLLALRAVRPAHRGRPGSSWCPWGSPSAS